MEDSLPNVKERDVIKALNDFFLHLIDRRRMLCHTKAELCHSLVLFDKVEFTMILGVKVTQVAVRLNQLLKLGLLRHEIGLQKKDLPTAIVSVARGTIKAWALCKEIGISFRP
jgi:hypothetical protein